MIAKLAYSPRLIVGLAMFLILSAFPGSTWADTGGLVGVVVNMGTGLPIASVRISAADQSTHTDAQGHYSLSLPAGTYDVRAEAQGYIGMGQRYQRVAGASQTVLDFEMIPLLPSPEEAAVIDARMMPPLQEPPDDEAIQAQGYDLSSIRSVPRTLRVLMPDGTAVLMGMDDYLKGVVAAEVGAYWPTDALRAQAVAARSYGATRHAHAEVGADVCTKVHCQAWSSIHYDTTDQAVDDTHNVVGTYDGRIIQAFYFAHDDGHTRNNEDVWHGAPLPYCRSVSCPCGYTTMYGHGIGMCQRGAQVLAQQGQGYMDILKHYYTDIAVEAPTPGRTTSVSVQPLNGDRNTQFAYEASYASATGDLPAVANVLIDGHARALVRVPGGSADVWSYRLVTALPVGRHTFSFYFDDGYGHTSRVPSSGTFPGPTVTEPDPTVPTPTPVPMPANAVLAEGLTHSTAGDWAGGTFDGIEVAPVGDGALRLQEGRSAGIYTSAVLTPTRPFVALGLTWYAVPADDSLLSFDIRTRQDETTWRAWMPLEQAEDQAGRGAPHTANLLFGLGNAVQYRVTLRTGAGGVSPALENVRLVGIDSRPGPSAAALAAQRLATPGQPAVITRRAWGADESVMTWPPEYRPVRALIMHHTVTDAGGVDPAAIVRAIYYYHAVVLEWGDIGYNYLVDQMGNFYEGRAGGPGVVGGHAHQYNWGSVGVALIGDYQTHDLPAPMLSKLTDFLAWQCTSYGLNPGETRPFIDKTLPVVMGHRDCEATVCPGDRAYGALSTIRAQTLAKMASVQITSPVAGQVVRAVADVSVQTSGLVRGVDYYVDGVLRGSVNTAPFQWKWSTLTEGDGPHQLRAVVQDSGGLVSDETLIGIDNTPPIGAASAPPWSGSTRINLTLTSPDAVALQCSNAWVWEGEALYHRAGSGQIVADADALNGWAWRGRAGSDTPGDWFGPYTCALPDGHAYRAYYRLKTADRALEANLARLDVADRQGQRHYDQRTLTGTDFARDNAYQEFALNLDYAEGAPTCGDPAISDGLEFVTAYLGTGDLYLDRITVFSAPQPISRTLSWEVKPEEGPQTVTVRFLDAVGNARDQAVRVNLDLTPPRWSVSGTFTVTVQDALSGLDTGSLAYALSSDSGRTWTAWQPLTVTATPGITWPLQISLPGASGASVRFRARDMVGHATEGESSRVWLPLVLKRQA